MEIKEIDNNKVWTNFFNQNGSPSFLQSWEWGELQKDLGYQILRLGTYDKNKLSVMSLVIKIKSKRGNFLFLPHAQSVNSYLLNYLKKIALKDNYSFIRVAPVLEDTPENKNVFQKLGFKLAPVYMHAETVWILPLNKSEELLLQEMRKTTRYSIRKAIKDGVVIEKRTDLKAVDDFYKIYQETAKREKFVPFTKDYVQKEFDEFNKTNNALFLFAKINNQYLASALIIFTNSTAFYHQGASIHTKVPTTYLLQWEVIKEAKKRNCLSYNFWGIYDKESKRMPRAWAGLTLFKTGFGGNKICYLPTQDYIVSPKYYLTFFLEKLLSFKRGV